MKNNMLSNVRSTMSKKLGRTELVLRKKSPEILLGAGIVGFVGTVVLACRSTLRVEDVLDYHNQKMKDIHEAKEIVEKDPEGELEYDDQLYKQDIAVLHVQTAGKLAKLYAAPIALGSVSLACIIASRNILNNRYLAAVAAYNSVSAVFKEYRRRVCEEYGPDLDRHFRYGVKYGTEAVIDEKGKKTKQKVETENINSENISSDDTARFFDSKNDNWDPNPQFSRMFLNGHLNLLNDILHTRGHLFLNEVYDDLGYPHTPEGAILGWIDDGTGNSFVDFGLFNKENESVRRYVNGDDNVILLTFNCDGIIWDKI